MRTENDDLLFVTIAPGDEIAPDQALVRHFLNLYLPTHVCQLAHDIVSDSPVTWRTGIARAELHLGFQEIHRTLAIEGVARTVNPGRGGRNANGTTAAGAVVGAMVDFILSACRRRAS